MDILALCRKISDDEDLCDTLAGIPNIMSSLNGIEASYGRLKLKFEAAEQQLSELREELLQEQNQEKRNREYEAGLENEIANLQAFLKSYAEQVKPLDSKFRQILQNILPNISKGFLDILGGLCQVDFNIPPDWKEKSNVQGVAIQVLDQFRGETGTPQENYDRIAVQIENIIEVYENATQTPIKWESSDEIVDLANNVEAEALVLEKAFFLYQNCKQILQVLQSNVNKEFFLSE